MYVFLSHNIIRNNCILIIMSIYLETYLEMHPNSKYLFTEDDADIAPIRLKDKFTNNLRTHVWRKPEFKELAPSDSTENDVGGHSGRKCPAEYAANCGASYIEVEIRGRWKGQKGGKVVFRYINVQQLFEDAKVCAILCRGGAVMYEVVPAAAAALTDAWLFEHIVPNITRRFGNDRGLCKVLALPLLYICLSENEDVYVPSALRDRVRGAYNVLNLDIQQPIRKVPLVVHRIDGLMHIDPVRLDGDEGGDTTVTATSTTGAVGGGRGVSNELVQSFMVRVNRLEHQQSQHHAGTSNQLTEMRSFIGSQFRRVNRNVSAFGGTIEGGALVRQRASNSGQRPLGPNAAAGAPAEATATPAEATSAELINNPKTLMELWNEYDKGINGRKAARKFTTAERVRSRKMKQKYWRRNHVWQAIERLVRKGRTPMVACNEIRTVYANVSVTKIIENMIDDKKRYLNNGGIHPDLC